MQHLLDIESLSRDSIQQCITAADRIASSDEDVRSQPASLMTLFFEPSTRTRLSFELASKRCGLHTLDFPVEMSALKKAETFEDTFLTLQAMGVDIFVVRHGEDFFPHMLSKIANDHTHIINAGDGCHAHPTQALLDMMTISQHKVIDANLCVAIVGDVKHSRVAKSDIAALKKLGVKDIRVIAPGAWQLNDIACTDNLKAGLEGVDVVITLRVQKERLSADDNLDLKVYQQQFQLNETSLAFAKPDAILMHPGPMNRGIEITDSVADGAHSCISAQVKNGVAMRMAIIQACF